MDISIALFDNNIKAIDKVTGVSVIYWNVDPEKRDEFIAKAKADLAYRVEMLKDGEPLVFDDADHS